MRPDLIKYDDPVDGTRGWLVYRDVPQRLAAGGCRVQPGLDAATLGTLAERMALKQRVLGINVAGAKCGLDLDPGAPGKSAVLSRFFTFLHDELVTRYSMGPDMGTGWLELNRHAEAVGLPSIKYAIKTAQRLSDDEFGRRMAVLEAPVRGVPISARRAGHALAHAAIAAARGTGTPTVALQGFGNLGRGAACTLLEAGARVVAVGDKHGTVADPAGVDIAAMLGRPSGTPVPAMPSRGRVAHLFTVPADVLILAGPSDAMTTAQAAQVPVSTVVVGANCGLTESIEQALAARDIVVVPDFIGGIGGSASMEVLFSPLACPAPQQVLDALTALMNELVADVLAQARRSGVTPRVAATRLAAASTAEPESPPYGSCPYLRSSLSTVR
ncbi:Glu/Leu/Phe/Val dehydrogenase dimerization domain-containing protein [Streptomyces iconiensis]|uniref:Glu/Leu/Phe/Val dehydrogenase dimerization domain-containing protein n=1 Tax=Streptomyces iconiensis TaxID=1384038 RepID=A0ABT7A291_9ACTN|nr:Glu/Leu/Phe/Val dehydrogenase dimerization domain-containing protein [Streptomyces iconiensis]MDJ1135434.1 Glu/Leu/Phe/Val dehydrogenase dimerization domain-containing protein [Streptomyces iconiensis]